MVRLSFAVVLATTTAVLGKPIAAPEPTPAPDLKRATLDKRTETCTFSGSGGASSASVSQADCSTIILSALAVPSGVTLELTSLEEGTTIIFEGETTFGFEEWSGPLVSIAGTDITVTGASGSYLNGNGADYWDGLGSDGGVTKPEFFWAHNMISSSINSVYILNSPVQVFSIDDSTDLTLTDITVDNTAGNTDDLAANTDGFDIASSTGITITGANIYNQDDCVAINSGSGITFSNGVCSGGHGLSIGSVGGRDDNTVETVLFENSEIVSSQNGVRIKTISDDTGTVEGITYSNILLSGITEYGILVDQAYDGTAGEPTNGVTISKFVLDNIAGTVESGGVNIYIECGDGSCTDWTWTEIDITGGSTADCLNVPSGISCS